MDTKRMIRSRQWQLGLVAKVSAASLIALPWLAGCLADPEPPATDRLTTPFTAASFNIRVGNPYVHAIRDVLLSSDAEIIAIQEYRPSSHPGLLEDLQIRYPHQTICPHGTHAVALLSRLPPMDSGCVGIGQHLSRSTAWMHVDGPSGMWTALSVHLSHPLMSSRARGNVGVFEGLSLMATDFAEQLSQFTDLADFVIDRGADGPIIVMGDFNAEPSWPHFQAFLDQTGLAAVDSPPGTRPIGIGPLFIAIDHVLAGNGARVRHIETGPAVGSDHLPVIATINDEEG